MMNSITDLINAYRTGSRKPEDVVEQMLDDIAASALNAYITVMADDARRDARAIQERLASGAAPRALEGVPISIKDLINVAGHRTTMGSVQYADHITERDAEVVQRLREHGAIIIGKANTHQFAYGSTGDRSHFGPVRNPHNPLHMPGGSSSGSAASVAGGLAYGSIGTDTSASVRLPAALCGVVGIKPTHDLISRSGVFGLSKTLDHVGPISRNVRDNALLLEASAGKPAGTYSSAIGRDIEGMVIGVPHHFFCEYLSPAVEHSLNKAIAALRAGGAVVKKLDIDNIYDIYNAQQLILKTEAYATHQAAIDAGEPYIQEVRDRLLSGKHVPSADYEYSLQFRDTARASFDAVLDDVDVVLTATCGITAPPLDERETLLNGREYQTPWVLTRLTAPTNLTGHPSLSVPFMRDEHLLPIGMQLIGHWHDEATLYQAGHYLEAY